MLDTLARRAIRRNAILVGLSLLLAGCGRTATIGNATSERTIENASAYVLPPPGGPSIIAVTERSYSNGIEQQIALGTASTLPGQNAFRVRLFGPAKGPAIGQTALPGQFNPLQTIASDIRGAIPGVALQRSPFFVRNRYGPFGYAVGRRGDDTCLYAWQDIRSRSFTFNDRGSIDMRLRLCETGATEQKLLAVVYGFTLNVFVDGIGWNPYGEPAGVPEGLSGPGPEIYPQTSGTVQTVLPDPIPATARAPTQRRRTAARTPVRPTLPAPVGPTVPAPPVEAAETMPTVPIPPAE